MDRLKDKVAIITGSTSGMGRETAYVFAEEGAKVMIVGRNAERAQAVVDKIVADGGEAAYVLADMRDATSVENIADATLEKFGTIDILYNNAGQLSITPTLDLSLEELEQVTRVNVNAAFILSKKVAPVMKAKGKGIIINTGSVAGTAARHGLLAYCTTKHAVNGLTRALARELGPEIRVNAILPGAIMTAMLESIGGEAAVGAMVESSPLKRIGNGREIGTAALFFATDDSSFVTGQLLRVDGGVDC
ncbi:MAG TPA: 3-oxoacyl-ACP reductase [Coriobacteriia bacterium]|nr:3-oxoacyl-ACP reductase [Coriobacteriia bacterium]